MRVTRGNYPALNKRETFPDSHRQYEGQSLVYLIISGDDVKNILKKPADPSQTLMLHSLRQNEPRRSMQNLNKMAGVELARPKPVYFKLGFEHAINNNNNNKKRYNNNE